MDTSSNNTANPNNPGTPEGAAGGPTPIPQISLAPKNDVILYIGEDFRFWNQIQMSINAIVSGKTIQHKIRKIDNYDTLPTQILKLIKLRPGLIYLDFAKDPEFAMMLGKMLRRLTATKEMLIIALFDSNADENLIIQAGAAGIFLCHLKGIEIHDVAYDAMVLLNPKDNIKCKFAVAQTKKRVEILENLRIRQISTDNIMIEGNAPLEKEEIVDLNVPMLSRVMPARQYTVKDSGDTNLYHDFLRWYKFSYNYLEPLAPMAEGDDKEEYLAREKQRKEELQHVKKEFEKWVEKNSGEYQQTCKILVVDKRLRLMKDFQEKKIPTQLGVRYQLYLSNPEEELRYYQPHIIVYGFDPQLSAINIVDEKEEDINPNAPKVPTGPLQTIDPDDADDIMVGDDTGKNIVDGFDLDVVGPILKQLPTNDDAALEALTTAIRKIPNYTPAVITLSNWPYHNSEYFKTRLKYPRMLHDKGVFNIEKILKFDDATRKAWQAEEEKYLKDKLEKLKKVNPTKYRSAKLIEIKDKVIFFKKKDPRSFIYLTHRVMVTSISESEMEIETKKKLRVMTVYHMPIPVEISVTPISETSTKDGFVYRCLIHSAGEKEKSAIRQFVNDVFLEVKRKERKQEAEQFSKMNEDARKQKIKEAEEAKAKKKTGEDDDVGAEFAEDQKKASNE